MRSSGGNCRRSYRFGPSGRVAVQPSPWHDQRKEVRHARLDGSPGSAHRSSGTTAPGRHRRCRRCHHRRDRAGADTRTVHPFRDRDEADCAAGRSVLDPSPLGERGERFTGELNVRRGSDGSTALALDGRFESAPGRLTPEGPADAVRAFFDQVVRRLGKVAELSALGAFRSASPAHRSARITFVVSRRIPQSRPGRVRGAHALPDERPLILPSITATATEPTAVSSVRLDSITLRYLA